MKFAPVCPIHIYKALHDATYRKGETQDIIGDYFLLLAHDVIANQAAYHEFFTMLRAERDITIIMDNSVIELGSSCNASVLVQACEIVNADVLVIPDVLEDGIATVSAADKFLGDWEEYAKPVFGDDLPALMFVPQGSHQTQWEHCVKMAAEEFASKIKWVGIPRNLTDRIYHSRTFAVDIVKRYLPDVKIHMLGFSDHTTDDLATCHAYMDDIEGIDSAVPLRILEPLNFPIQDAGKRGDWWETAEISDQMIANLIDIRHRVGELKE